MFHRTSPAHTATEGQRIPTVQNSSPSETQIYRNISVLIYIVVGTLTVRQILSSCLTWITSFNPHSNVVIHTRMVIPVLWIRNIRGFRRVQEQLVYSNKAGK